MRVGNVGGVPPACAMCACVCVQGGVCVPLKGGMKGACGGHEVGGRVPLKGGVQGTQGGTRGELRGGMVWACLCAFICFLLKSLFLLNKPNVARFSILNSS